MSQPLSSLDSLADASRYRASFSGHGNAKGAAGSIPEGETGPDGFLTAPGDFAIVNPHEHGFRPIRIGMAWENLTSSGEKRSTVKKLAAQAVPQINGGIDLDLGCLYELQTGERGAIQAFGDRYGNFDEKPFITLSGDERTGDASGEDELLIVNGQKWPEIKRLLLYAYIYGGTPDWSIAKPLVKVRIAAEPDVMIIPEAGDSSLTVCAVASLENVRNGIRITNHTEYFAGHAEMDRAFGFGLSWENGAKS